MTVIIICILHRKVLKCEVGGTGSGSGEVADFVIHGDENSGSLTWGE